jgi:hypothetical protein
LFALQNDSLGQLLDTAVDHFQGKPVWTLIEQLALQVPFERRVAFIERQQGLQGRYDPGRHPNSDECEFLDTRHHPTTNRWRGRFQLWIHADRIKHQGRELGFFVIYHLEPVDFIPDVTKSA